MQTLFKVTLLVAVCATLFSNATAQQPTAKKDGKLYELRFYTTNPGKLPDLHARFRDHTMKLFEKHGMENIISTQQRVAAHYFEDGSIADACPPLRALLHIMRDDTFEGKALDHPHIRSLFTREKMMTSDWYAARLKAKQHVDHQLWQRHVRYLETFLTKSVYADEASRLGIRSRLAEARQTLASVKKPGHLKQLHGTLGTDPMAIRPASLKKPRSTKPAVAKARRTKTNRLVRSR